MVCQITPLFDVFEYLFKFSLVESEVLEIIIPSTLLFKRTSVILLISLSFISGETLTTIGIFEFKFFFLFQLFLIMNLILFDHVNFLNFLYLVMKYL